MTPSRAWTCKACGQTNPMLARACSCGQAKPGTGPLFERAQQMENEELIDMFRDYAREARQEADHETPGVTDG